MPFEKGKSGNPGGRPKNTEWADEIRLAVKRRAEGGDIKVIRKLAEAIVNAGLSGDIAALKEIGDRLDGKPQAQVNVVSESTVTVRSEQLSETDSWLADMLGGEAGGTAEKPRPN